MTWFFQPDARLDPKQLVQTDADNVVNPEGVSDLGTLDKDMSLLLTRLTKKVTQLHKEAAKHISPSREGIHINGGCLPHRSRARELGRSIANTLSHSVTNQHVNIGKLVCRNQAIKVVVKLNSLTGTKT